MLEDYPESFDDEVEAPLSCPLPPRHDPDVHPAIDEARALRAAYDRALAKNGRTSVGRAIGPEEVPGEIEKFIRIAEGEAWDKVGLKSLPWFVVQDLRSYYEEIASELEEGPMAAWAAESWFYDKTEAGKVVISARRKMRKTGAPYLIWSYMTPATRPS